jgi:hypothetical protein
VTVPGHWHRHLANQKDAHHDRPRDRVVLSRSATFFVAAVVTFGMPGTAEDMRGLTIQRRLGRPAGGSLMVAVLMVAVLLVSGLTEAAAGPLVLYVAHTFWTPQRRIRAGERWPDTIRDLGYAPHPFADGIAGEARLLGRAG